MIACGSCREGQRQDRELRRAPTLDIGFLPAREDLKPERRFVVHPGDERELKMEDVEVIDLPKLTSLVTQI